MSIMFSLTIIFSAMSAAVLALNPPGNVAPLARHCGPIPSIVCMNKYGAVMPYHFFREPSANGSYEDTYASTSVPSDPTFSLVSSADFLVFDEQRGLELLGSQPSYEFMYKLSDAVHEAPVYSPVTNKLYFSQLRGMTSPPGFLPQLVVNLNVEPPELGELISDPPIYAPNGGTIHNGLIYWAVSGGNNSIGGIEERPGIATLDPLTNKTVTLLNNYFGYYFNCVDDIAVDDNGDVWFTDPQYSWFNALTDTAPQLETASYRFNPSTGAVTIIDDSIVQPNGIAFGPKTNSTCGRTVYISDTGAIEGPILQSLGPQGSPFNTTGKRTVYAFDLTPNGKHIINKRPVYLAQDWVPDGLKVAANGYIRKNLPLPPAIEAASAENLVAVTGAGKGVDVLDEDGTLLVRVQTNFTVQNFAWTGSCFQDLWIVGNSGAARVKWNLPGQELR